MLSPTQTMSHLRYFVILLVASEIKLGYSFQLIRGATDIFSNPQCSEQQCLATCSPHYAKCKTSSCRLCVCDEAAGTYVAAEKRCVQEKDIFSRSAPRYSTVKISYGETDTFMLVAKPGVLSADLYEVPVPTGAQEWMYTVSGQLINIRTLECVDARDPTMVTVRPCRLIDNESQKWKCDVHTYNNKSRLYQLAGNKTRYLALLGDIFYMYYDSLPVHEWIPHHDEFLNRLSVCDAPDTYQGCYRFQDGSFIKRFSRTQKDDECKDRTASDCFEELDISAPMFVNNSDCTLIWKNSMFSVNDQTWASLSGYENYFTGLSTNENARKIKLKMHRQAKVVWAGLLLKLEIKCKGIPGEPPEQHCVLLKFDGTYAPQPKPTNATQRPATTPATSSPAAIDASSSRSCKHYKTSTIVLSILVSILLLLLAYCGYLVYNRQRTPAWYNSNDIQAKPFCETVDQGQI